MTKRQSKKRALLTSIISLILCVTMLAGTTFSWFKDVATNTGNSILIGEFEMDVLMDKGEDGNYVSIKNSEGDIFSEKAGNGTHWEPGKTEIVYLKVVNKGNLALKYSIYLDITDNGIADAFEYAVLDGATAAAISGADSWSDIKAYPGVQISDMPSGKVTAAPNGKLLAEEEDVFALAVHMKEDIGDEVGDNAKYQGKQLTFDLKVLATQVPEEEDSFGSDYDANAAFGPDEMELIEGPSAYVNYTRNSDMQAGTSKASYWNGNSYVAKDEDGNQYITGGSAISSKSYAVNQTATGLEGGETYKISLKIRRISGNPLRINLQPRVGTTSTLGTKSSFTLDQVDVGSGWQTVEFDYTLPEGYTAIILEIAFDITSGTDSEVHVDDVQVLARRSDNAVYADSFKAMLEEEAAKSMKFVDEAEGEDLTTPLPPLEGHDENMIKDPGFESGTFTTSTEDTTGWYNTFPEYVSINTDSENVHTGNYSLKITHEAGQASNPFAEQYNQLVGGAQYQLSFWYKVVEGTKAYPVVKAELWIDHTLPGSANIGQAQIGSSSPVRDGEWHQVTKRFNVGSSVTESRTLARVLSSAASEKGAVEIYIDDIELYMVKAPTEMTLDTDQIFYYTDAEGASFDAIANIEYYPELVNGTVDFQVYDGQTLLWENLGVEIDDKGVAATAFSLAELMKMETPYCVNATMYDAEGNIVDQKSQNIYMYERPEYLQADGVFRANGTDPIYPVLAYHVYADKDDKTLLTTYKRVAAAGINVVQSDALSAAEDALVHLNAAQEAGIMVNLVLYKGMKPAASDENIENTINILNDERVVTHPALYGYLVMDEPFLHAGITGEDMENCYRLVRMYDKTHPIMTVEAFSANYGYCAKFVDALIIDPYCSAAEQRVSEYTAKAVEAVNGEKPIYTLMETYLTAALHWNTYDDGRNNNYQALLSGASGIGYFSMSDAYKNSTIGVNYAIWDVPEPDDGLWKALTDFGTKEKDIVFDHFLAKNSPTFNEGKAEDQTWYYSWAADGGIYMVVLGLKEDQSVDLSIPLISADGSVSIGAYTAEVIAGNEEAVSGNGTLNLTVNGVEAILYKITPSSTVNFSSLK